MLQDIATNFKDMDSLVAKYTPQQLIDDNFGHFNIQHLDPVYPDYVCGCSRERIEDMIRTLGKKEAQDIIDQQGVIEVSCEFCHKKYCFDADDVEKIFEEI